VVPNGVIYGVFDPRDGRLVYIGKAIDFRRRVHAHTRKLLNGTHENRRLNALFGYVRRIHDADLVFRVLLRADAERLPHIERSLIAAKRLRGVDLFNVAAGGEGGAGPRSHETRRRISIALAGRPKPPRTAEHRERLAAKKRGVRQSPETRARHSATAKIAAMRGSQHYAAKLDDGKVREICRLLRAGVEQWRIGEQFNVARTTVMQIATGRTWKHVAREAMA
jgi:hypothetical protein